MRIVPYIIAAGIYIALRLTILRFTEFKTMVAPPPLSLRLIAAPAMVMKYIQLLFMLKPLTEMERQQMESVTYQR